MARAKKLSENETGSRYEVVVEPAELAMLRSLPPRLMRILQDPSVAPRVIDRLFPPVHSTDATAEAEYLKLMGNTLLERRRSALSEFEDTLRGTRTSANPVTLLLDRFGIDLWLHVINDLRLLLALELDIQDNEWSLVGPSRPEDLPDFSLLLHLSDLQEVLIEVI